MPKIRVACFDSQCTGWGKIKYPRTNDVPTPIIEGDASSRPPDFFPGIAAHAYDQNSNRKAKAALANKKLIF